MSNGEESDGESVTSRRSSRSSHTSSASRRSSIELIRDKKVPNTVDVLTKIVHKTRVDQMKSRVSDVDAVELEITEKVLRAIGIKELMTEKLDDAWTTPDKPKKKDPNEAKRDFLDDLKSQLRKLNKSNKQLNFVGRMPKIPDVLTEDSLDKFIQDAEIAEQSTTKIELLIQYYRGYVFNLARTKIQRGTVSEFWSARGFDTRRVNELISFYTMCTRYPILLACNTSFYKFTRYSSFIRSQVSVDKDFNTLLEQSLPTISVGFETLHIQSMQPDEKIDLSAKISISKKKSPTQDEQPATQEQPKKSASKTKKPTTRQKKKPIDSLSASVENMKVGDVEMLDDYTELDDGESVS